MGYNPQESLENTINTMGTLLGVHPIVLWKMGFLDQKSYQNSCQFTKSFVFFPSKHLVFTPPILTARDFHTSHSIARCSHHSNCRGTGMAGAGRMEGGLRFCCNKPVLFLHPIIHTIWILQGHLFTIHPVHEIVRWNFSSPWSSPK